MYKNQPIERQSVNTVFPIKFNKNISVAFYNDLVPDFSNKFVYTEKTVKGADGYCIILNKDLENLMAQQLKGSVIIYDGNGGVKTYVKPPLPNNIVWYKPKFDYETEKWEETATDKEIIDITYNEYKLYDTPRYSRLMSKAGIIDDYDDFMWQCEIYLESLEPVEIPVPSELLKEFIKNNKQ